MRIDLHNHLGYDPVNDETRTSEELLEEMRTAEVDKAVIFPFTSNPDIHEQNELIRKARNINPEELIAFATINPKLTETGLADLHVHTTASDGTLTPDAGKDYVSYELKLLAGRTSGPGPNPEDSLVTTARYHNHFSERWGQDGTEITAAGATGVDILDRDKFQFRPGVCNRTTDTFSAGGGAFIANIDGPVRAIRSVIGANSGCPARITRCATESFSGGCAVLRVPWMA